VPEAHVAATRRLLARLRVPRILDVVAGGADRQESVWRALQRIPEGAERVVVHDAVRPFIDAALVARVLAAAASGGAATCGIPVRETVKRVTDGAIEATIPRQGLWLTQTPQAFTRALLWEAHDKARRDGFAGTDDAVLVERLGVTVAMVHGLAQNLKITTPEDLQTARAWAAPRRRG
jgi:2-C-methyl-D-erythritol 4-phosphate cytidylyltransferase